MKSQSEERDLNYRNVGVLSKWGKRGPTDSSEDPSLVRVECFTLTDKGPSIETLDEVCHISAVHQPFLYVFDFRHLHFYIRSRLTSLHYSDKYLSNCIH